MSTQAQVLANRENAKHSTGPKTEEGKQKSSQNATTHGFYAKSFVVRDDEREAFETMREKLGRTYGIVDAVAEDFFQQILHATWNLHRLRQMENEIYASSGDPFGEEKTLKRLDALRRHKAHFERSLRLARKSMIEHTTAVYNLTTIPPEMRGHFSSTVDAVAYNRAHAAKWKTYCVEDFASKEEIAAVKADTAKRRALLEKSGKLGKFGRHAG